jgi:hypothetical protein
MRLRVLRLRTILPVAVACLNTTGFFEMSACLTLIRCIRMPLLPDLALLSQSLRGSEGSLPVGRAQNFLLSKPVFTNFSPFRSDPESLARLLASEALAPSEFDFIE